MEGNDNKVSEDITNEGTEIAENTAKIEKTKHKIRQKKILGELQKQIAFYFSEPNLQKDRFLRQQLLENDNGCVEIETIASFNRMKQLCNDISLIVKAMKLCPSVKVIDDKWVKPSQPLPEPKNVDSVTVYVERLPPDADHNWIRSIFSQCGNVVYISLPRYKTTREIKQFAFVEFEKESEAEAAITMFAEKENNKEENKDENTIEGKTENNKEHAGKHIKKNKKRKAKLSESEHDDAKVKNKKSKRKRDDSCDDGTFADTSQGTDTTDEQKKSKRNIEKKNCREIDYENVKGEKEQESELSESDNTLERTNSNKRKRKRSEEACDDDHTSNKKNKQDQESDDEDTSRKNIEEVCAQDGANELEVNDSNKKKKKRKRKKKENQETELPQLRVISKTEWINLKKEYQKLQRQAMKDAKQKLKIDFQAKGGKSDEDKTQLAKIDSLEGTKNIVNQKKKAPPQKLEMQPGVVLKFYCDENTDKRQLKNTFSVTAPVAYIEKDADSNTGYVRFSTKEACDKVVETFSSSGSLENVKIEKLTEREDVEYWERLNKDRLERFQHGTKRNRNRRGRQKITKKIDERNAMKRDHIHFED